AGGDVAPKARISDMRVDALLAQEPLQHGRIGILLANAEAGGIAGADRHDVELPCLQWPSGESEDRGDHTSAQPQNHPQKLPAKTAAKSRRFVVTPSPSPSGARCPLQRLARRRPKGTACRGAGNFRSWQGLLD